MKQQNQVSAETAVWSIRIWEFSWKRLGPNASPTTHYATLRTLPQLLGSVSFSVNQGVTLLSQGDCEVGKRSYAIRWDFLQL